ncbi:5'-3' exonuclease [Actinomadura rayongensis]|uniref:5'-3' exonuclease n=1 Tax=Actinomadura rayongensis TaxID=1429076 RepID=A0A6I4WCY3_9ACTN|nr:5'-3' exonuclease H3TH domain-containing protein [Actinomadura rayongensis]MXQ64924.1 flap endonuclease [Actinomadura rayongensis]
MTPLLAVDGHHLLYRSWWGFSDRRIMSRDKTRDLTGVFGFLAILRKTHLEEARDHEIVVVFDGENAHLARQAQDPSYKANRIDADHSPIKSLPMVKEALTTAGVRWIELDDHEGDDVIATLTHNATGAGRTVTCYSGDRDLFQLVSETVTILDPARRRITPADVIVRHRVAARQWPDYRALTGDPSDNIPGVPGIGPKTAATLLAGGLHLDDLPHSPRLNAPRCRTIPDHWDQLITWRNMIRLNTTIPLPPNTTTAQPTAPMPRAAELLEDLNLW